MFEVIYSWNVAEELQDGGKVYAVYRIENGVIFKDAEELTMREWVDFACGKEITFLKEKKHNEYL